MAPAPPALRCPVAFVFDLTTTFLGVLRDTPIWLVVSAKINATKQRNGSGAEAVVPVLAGLSLT
jgi:hypothetical protein